jgi:hypothetical protein
MSVSAALVEGLDSCNFIPPGIFFLHTPEKQERKGMRHLLLRFPLLKGRESWREFDGCTVIGGAGKAATPC